MQIQGKYLKYLLESSVENILFIDKKGLIIYCTYSMLRLANIQDFSEIAGKPYQSLYEKFGGEELAHKGELHYTQVKQSLRASSSEVSINFPGQKKIRGTRRGGDRVYNINVAPMIDEAGVFDGVIATHYDTTKTARIARRADARSRELEVQMQAAQVATEAKSRFLASMSHEIRTPMNAIIGMSDLIRTDNLDMTQKVFFDDIRKMSKSLLQIINDVLDFSRIEAGKLEIVPVHFKLLELVNNICSMSRFLADAKGLYFYDSYDPAIPEAIYGDDVRIRQILFNLINNAIKYTRDGYVAFKASRTKKDSRDFILFEVKDTGIGIKDEDIKKLFNAFYQVDMTVNRGIGGSGLGLSITKNLVALMGGEIGVESTYGKGSVFKVLLPMTLGDPGLVFDHSIASFITVGDGARVLVVDDSQINLKVAVAYLERHNVHAETALSASEAILKIQKKNPPYDLVFMDHMMPGMDGAEATRRLRASGHDKLPIIALSANAVEGVRERFIEAGMNDFISKPIEPDELNRVLMRWLPAELILHGEQPQPQAQKSRDCNDDAANKVKTANVMNVAKTANTGMRTESPGGDPLSKINPVINFADGINNTLGDRELYQKLLQNFIGDHGKDYITIRDAIDSGAPDEASLAAHKLKGVAALLGANRLRQIAFSIETLLGEGELGKAKKALTKLDAELSAVINTIKQL